MSKYKEWYGIVDGYHHNMAIRWLKTNKTSWEKVQLYVTILNGGHPIEEYERLGRFQNHRHSSKYYVDVTIYDQLNNLRREFDRLSKIKSSVTQKEVSQSYFGCPKVNRTMTMLASVAIRLPVPVLKEIGNIMNSEQPGLCLKKNSSFDVRSEEEMMSTVDCRFFRSFTKLNSLYGSRCFMNHDP